VLIFGVTQDKVTHWLT